MNSVLNTSDKGAKLNENEILIDCNVSEEDLKYIVIGLKILVVKVYQIGLYL